MLFYFLLNIPSRSLHIVQYEDLMLFNILQVCTAVLVVLLILEDYQLEAVIFSGSVV